MSSIGSLGEAVRVAEAVTDESMEDPVISTLKEGMDESAKAEVYDLYDKGEISERVARQLLDDEAFEDAEEMTRGAEQILSGDTSRFLSE